MINLILLCRFLLSLSVVLLVQNMAYAKTYNISCDGLHLIKFDDLSVVQKIRFANGLNDSQKMNEMSEALLDIIVATPLGKEKSLYFLTGFFQKAQLRPKKLEQALLQQTRDGLPEKLVDNLKMLGLFYFLIEKPDEAKLYFEKAVALEGKKDMADHLISNHFLTNFSRTGKPLNAANEIGSLAVNEVDNENIDTNLLFVLGRLSEVEGHFKVSKNFYQRIIERQESEKREGGTDCLLLNLTADRLSGIFDKRE